LHCPSYRLWDRMSATNRSLVGRRSRYHRHLKIVTPLRRDDLRDLHRSSHCQDSGRGLCPVRFPQGLMRGSTMLGRELYGNTGIFSTTGSSMENPWSWCPGLRRGNRLMNSQKTKWTGLDGNITRTRRADDGEGRVLSNTFDSGRGQIGMSSLLQYALSELCLSGVIETVMVFDFGAGLGHLTRLPRGKAGNLNWIPLCRMRIVLRSCDLHAKHGCGQEYKSSLLMMS
jgi:hypothetical protein